MSANRIEALRQIIARPTTCAGERAAAQQALNSLLSKQPKRRPQAPSESFTDWFVRTQRETTSWAAPSRTTVDPPKSGRVDITGLPKAERREPNETDTYKIEVESEARMATLFRGADLDWHVNRDGEVWIIDYTNGFIRDDSGATKRWFVIVHASNMRKA